MSDFSVQSESREKGVVVRLRGDATCTDTEAIRQALQPILDRRPRCVVLDLTELDFINSLGLGVLLEFRQDLSEQGGRLDLAGARDDVIDVLRKTRLVELFPPYETPDQALNAQRGPIG